MPEGERPEEAEHPPKALPPPRDDAPAVGDCWSVTHISPPVGEQSSGPAPPQQPRPMTGVAGPPVADVPNGVGERLSSPESPPDDMLQQCCCC